MPRRRHKRRLKGDSQGASTSIANLVPNKAQRSDRAVGLVIFEAWSAKQIAKNFLETCAKVALDFKHCDMRKKKA